MPQLVIDIAGGGDGVGDFGFHGFAESLAEAVDGDFHGALAHAELGGDFGLGGACAGEVGFELFKVGGFACFAQFAVDDFEGAGDDGECPLAVETAVVIRLRGEGEPGAGAGVEGDVFDAAAALFGVRLFAVVGEEVLYCAEDVAAKSATPTLRSPEGFPSEDALEKFVREFASGVGCAAFASEKSDDGFVVGGAEFGEGGLASVSLPRAWAMRVQRVALNSS